MKDNEEKNTNKNIQDMLNKLIADEWFAGNIYKQFVIAVNQSQVNLIREQMLDIAADEIDDHYASLVSFALANGYSVPSTYTEMRKFADKTDIKLFESCKKGQDALFYINLGIDSENRAIETYEKYVDDDELRLISELDMTVKNNYYDEQEHLSKLEFMKDSLEAMQQFN